MTEVRSNQVSDVLVVDDNVELRRALRLLLTREPRYRVVGEADSIAGLLSAVEATNPVVVLLDLFLSGLSVEVIRQVRKQSPAVRIVGLTSWTAPVHELTESVDSIVRQADGAAALLGALASAATEHAQLKAVERSKPP